MNGIEQSNLSNRFLRVIRDWLNYIIPEETKNCIRSKTAVVVKVNGNNTYNVILSEELADYRNLEWRLNMQVGDPDYDPNLKLTQAQFNEKVAEISIDNLVSIKNETYVVDDYIIVGYLDNKLTNSFILCKSQK